MQIEQFNYEVIYKGDNELGEGPVWDEQHKRIIWVNILQGEIHWLYPASGKHGCCQVGQPVGTIVIAGNGSILAALHHGFAFVDLDTAGVVMITDPESHLPLNRFNDGKCDTKGRLWAGTMSMNDATNMGALYMLDDELKVTKKASDISISNGLAWSPDNKTFYYTDTPTREVWAYDYESETGTIQNKRTILSFNESDGYPDGMTIDAEGMLWIAFWDGWKVERWNPENGELLAAIKLPVSRPTSCTFGGNNLQELYITSARQNLSDAAISAQPLAGALFVVKNTGQKGLPLNYFKGLNK